MRRAGTVAAIVAAAAVIVPAPARAAGGVSVTDMTPSFPVGPYVALTVDAHDPRRLAVTTSDGRLGWTRDGGHTGDEAVVIAPREYLSAPLRSQGPLFTLQQHQPPGGRTAISGLLGEAPGMRQFLWRLKEGQPVAKWQYWMSVENPATEIYDATIPGPGPRDARPLAATASGLFAADRAAGGWVRVVGLPQPRRGALAAYAVTVDPSDRRHVLAGTAAGLLVSHDGGATFAPHPDPDLAEVDLRRFSWDSVEPRHLLALAARAVYQSRDGGVTFSRAFATPDGVNAVALDDAGGVYIATGRGLIVPGAQARVLADETVVGVVAFGGGWLAATESTLTLRTAGGALRTLMRTGTDGSDAILRLEGNATAAWVLTRHNVFRVANDAPAREPPAGAPPRLQLSATGVEQAVLARLGIEDPAATRLGKPWYANLVPRITVGARSAVTHELATTFDALVPLPVRLRTSSTGRSCCGLSALGPLAPRESPPEFLVLVSWDVGALIAGFRAPTYPYGIIEMNLRAVRERVLPEVRWRYRDAAHLAKLLARPPDDPEIAFLWQTRLDEHAAYLEAMSGRRVVAHGWQTPE
jgi:hypothetical protein